MSPAYADLLKSYPFLFKNKVITTNFIRFCLSQYNITDLMFLAGMKDFHENTTLDKAIFLFESFCTYTKRISDGKVLNEESCLLNTTKQNVQLTKIKLETAISDYHFANKFTLNIKNVKQIPKIPASLGSCLDILLKEVKSTLITDHTELFLDGIGIYKNYAKKSILSISNKSNTLINYKITKNQVDELRKNCGFMYFAIFKLEMKTMFSLIKEVENMK